MRYEYLDTIVPTRNEDIREDLKSGEMVCYYPFLDKRKAIGIIVGHFINYGQFAIQVKWLQHPAPNMTTKETNLWVSDRIYKILEVL